MLLPRQCGHIAESGGAGASRLRRRHPVAASETIGKPHHTALSPALEPFVCACAGDHIHVTLTSAPNYVGGALCVMPTLQEKCQICRRSTQPGCMLLCDGCDRGFHTFCLNPRLKSVPSGEWYRTHHSDNHRGRTDRSSLWLAQVLQIVPRQLQVGVRGVRGRGPTALL